MSGALLAAGINGRLNGVELDTSESDLIGTECVQQDVILVGDMLYDSALSEVIASWLQRLHRGGKTVLIGDPGRGSVLFNGSLFLQLAKYELDRASQEDNYGFRDGHVFTFRPSI